MRRRQTAAAEPLDPERIIGVLNRVRSGDFTARMPAHLLGLEGKVADGLNEVIEANQAMAAELARVSRVVGKDGRLSQRASGSGQMWAASVEVVNTLIEDLVRPSDEMQRVIGAVADGDLSKKVRADAKGDMLELKNTINGMVDQLNGFISEVTRVAREVGTEGRLGQAAAYTIEVGGVWKELTDNVNLMAGNLTGQVRDIAEVTTAVANGDLSKKITADVRGEFLELKNTVNAMVDQLNRFAGEVTRVAREVGVEGKLGGQAQSQEVEGVWKDLTDDVNQLAANLTDQVRAIADVATAVTEGDLTRQVSVAASGEVAVLKDKLNEMIRKLRETMRQNTEQDWLKTHLERFARMLQGQRDPIALANLILSELAPLVGAGHGAFFLLTDPDGPGEPVLELQAGYGYRERRQLANVFRLGEGLVGQCGLEKERILLTDVPGDYVQISSGLGQATPLNVVVLPILYEGSLRAVIELASFAGFGATHLALLDQLTESIGLVLNNVGTISVTERLLEQAQSQAQLLAEKNSEVEGKYAEVEAARRLVEETATELSVSSRYKSEFIANMSHELRTPLNSLLVLAEQLEDNPEGNLTERQVQYASVIRSSGADLLKLLNDILDLAKIESKTVQVDLTDLSLAELGDNMDQTFQPLALKHGLAFSVQVDDDLPATIETDAHRLRQVLKNLLLNAFKFTESGSVSLRLSPASSGWSPSCQGLTAAPAVVAISVTDTGIGIHEDMHALMFEAFAQADGTAARPYGGTGLGLSISRDLVGLLGGEISVRSALGRGSTFTVYLPAEAAGTPPRAVPPSLPPEQLPAAAVPGDSFLRVMEAAPLSATDAAFLPEPDREQHRQVRSLDRLYATFEPGTTVLVVDDDFRNIFALTALLERGHLSVLAAQSGAVALEILDAREDVDIVLMDIMMPVMNGYETMMAIRRIERHADLPIIAVTGKVVGGERDRCMAAGASDYIPKPVDTAELLAALEQWILGSAAAQAARHSG